MLSAAVITALYLIAGYAVQGYVADQLGRIPWDITVGQRDAVRNYPAYQAHLRATPGVKSTQGFGFLRVINGSGVKVEVDGRPLAVRWMAIAAASDPSLLPAGLRPVPGSALKRAALIGTRDPITGAPVDVSAGSTLLLRKIPPVKGDGHSHSHGHDDEAKVDVSADVPEILFEAKLAEPAEMERQEFNKWMLRKIGAMAYLPEQAIVIIVPMDEFARVATLFDRSFGASAGLHGASAAPPYVPEMMHLVALDRDRWITPWRFETSLDALSKLQQRLYNDIRDVTIFSFVSSDTFATLNRMFEVNRLVGAVTLLVAVPLLWLSWAVANMLSGLLLINERRLIGLAVIRGVPVSMVSRALIVALIVGGAAGGVLGLALGIGLTIAGETLLGLPPPPLEILLQGAGYFLLFVLLGTLIALVSGWKVIRWVRDMTPREAIAHVSSREVSDQVDRSSALYRMWGLALLMLGLYKLFCWISGVDPFSSSAGPPSTVAQLLMVLDGLLNFVAVPFLLFGVTSLLRWRTGGIQYLLSALSAPLAGKLRWFVAEHMATNRQRVAGMLFISSLATAMALLPQVAADTLEYRMARGIDAAIGGDVQMDFGAADLARDAGGLRTAAGHAQVFGPGLAAIERAIRADPNVTGVTLVEQYIAPDVYVPNQQGLLVNLLQSASTYLGLVYSEPQLGAGRPFRDIIRDSADGNLITSTGLLQMREIPMHKDIALGFNGDEPVPARLDDAIAFLPGQPSIDVAQREGFAAAEVDYLNYLLGSDARVVAARQTFERGPLSRLHMLPSRFVFIVRMANGAAEDDIRGLIRTMPIQPQDVRWQAEERRKLSRDMFISLALANMNVFMIGGLVLAIAGVVVVGLANFLSERRTFSLLRLRGLPLPTVLRVSLSIFLVPVLTGVALGTLLGAIAGFGLAEAIWQLPRIYGVAGLLGSRMVFSGSAAAIVAAFGAILLIVALCFALWPFRGTANENLKDR